ncbi:hypothetical protein QYM41_16655 [Kocuria sp. CPCC 205268]|uniref:hypothetical protein n=1 Tax=Kocuria oxytropis TaxID=3058913 RepID=UPI0034D5E5BE
MPFVEDDILCVDLTEEGSVITDNQPMTMAPADSAETFAEDASSASPTQDDLDHP